MGYLLTTADSRCSSGGIGLRQVHTDRVDAFAEHLSEEKMYELVAAYCNGTLFEVFNRENSERFVLFLFDKQSTTLYAYNDHFGSADVLCSFKEGAWYVSNNASMLFAALENEPRFKAESIYETIAFQTIQPPDTIYENVFSIPLGSRATFRDEMPEFHQYWDIEQLLQRKSSRYDDLVEDVRIRLKTHIQQQDLTKVTVALSGGIDSGGLLGIATSAHESNISSITIGGRGPNTIDLQSSRKSAAYNHSQNEEIYPTIRHLKRLPKYVADLNQPIAADTLLPYSLIHERARERGADRVMYGLGAEMLLGNLKISKIAYMLQKVERLLPTLLLVPLYNFFARLLNLSETQRAFLLSFSWIERFMYTRAALYMWERNYFTTNQKVFWNAMQMKVERTVTDTSLPLLDHIVKLYLCSWVSYLQLRDLSALGRKYEIRPVLPFDTVAVASALFSTPTRFRRKNGWNKQLIRDVFKPFVSDHLYENRVRSLIIPYTELLKGREYDVLAYLKKSPILHERIDFPSLERDLYLSPEPGLFLFRMIGVAIWYDVNWGDGGENFANIFEKKGSPVS